MKIIFSQHARGDYVWSQQQDCKTPRRINALIDGIVREPFEGIGKPEPLRYEYQGAWSRRIDERHRLVYLIEDETVIILACRYHYE